MLTLPVVLHPGVQVQEQLIQQEQPGVVVEYLRQVAVLHPGVHLQHREVVHVLRHPAIPEAAVRAQTAVALIRPEVAAVPAVVEAIVVEAVEAVAPVVVAVPVAAAVVDVQVVVGNC